MQLIPAIDLRGGQVVRLLRGEAGLQKVYGQDPGVVAQTFVQQGAPLIHVVDLDGAFTGNAGNRAAIAKILRVPGAQVELGGGLRTAAAVAEALKAGVTRVVLGTMAVTHPETVFQLARKYNERIVVGIDARHGKAAIRGWTAGSEEDPVQMALKMEAGGVKRIIYTEISRDGTLAGPDYAALERLAAKLSIPVIASGGVSSLQDLRRLRSLEEVGIAGVIVGKALYEGVFTLKEALRATGGEE